ncbi:hypothetical protein D3C86_2239000 [compost metagenome]
MKLDDLFFGEMRPQVLVDLVSEREVVPGEQFCKAQGGLFGRAEPGIRPVAAGDDVSLADVV